MTMFEVDPIQGVQDRIGSRHHIPDIVEISPYGKSFVKSNISFAATDFPSDGFDLKLHVFYSKSFNDKFGSGTKSKYVSVLNFKRYFYFIFDVPLYTGLIHLWDILRPS
jgi:hypothetical protein